MKPKLMNMTEKDIVRMVADDPKVGNNKTNKYYRDYIYRKFGRKISPVQVTKAIGSLESRLNNDFSFMENSAKKFLLDCDYDEFLARRMLNRVAG